MKPDNIILLSELLQSLNNSLGYELFSGVYLSDYGTWLPIVKDANGNNIISKTVSFATDSIPPDQIELLQNAIQILHEWSDDKNIPKDKRNLCKELLLPDPSKNPDAYILSGPLWNRKLHVNWVNFSDQGVKPLSDFAKIKKWEDCDERKDLTLALKYNRFGKFFSLNRILGALACLLILAIIFLLLSAPRYCPVHNCVCGHGIFIDTEKNCPRRCPECRSHLDKGGYCINPSHICKECHKNQPLAPEKKGVCDKCFLKVR